MQLGVNEVKSCRSKSLRTMNFTPSSRLGLSSISEYPSPRTSMYFYLHLFKGKIYLLFKNYALVATPGKTYNYFCSFSAKRRCPKVESHEEIFERNTNIQYYRYIPHCNINNSGYFEQTS